VSLLEVTGLRASFVSDDARLPVIDDVSFSLDAGQVLGIVGESGSGKSMLALSLIRLVPRAVHIESGSVLLADADLLQLSEKRMNAIRGREIGMIFQDPVSSLNPTRRIGAQIAEVIIKQNGTSRRDAFRRAVELLDEVRIPQASRLIHSYPFELSGGMCQRVMIAIALACTPRLLIADEPTTALDATVEVEVLKLLGELRAAHDLAMIFISHDMRVVADIADHVAVMYAGEFVEQGPSSEVFARPQHPYTEALLACSLHVDRVGARRQRLQVIPGSPPRLGQWHLGCRFSPRCAYVERECEATHPRMRDVAPGHRVRTVHPFSERHP
jgi:peptide/nickel transport system ATP-binding protein